MKPLPLLSNSGCHPSSHPSSWPANSVSHKAAACIPSTTLEKEHATDMEITRAYPENHLNTCNTGSTATACLTKLSFKRIQKKKNALIWKLKIPHKKKKTALSWGIFLYCSSILHVITISIKLSQIVSYLQSIIGFMKHIGELFSFWFKPFLHFFFPKKKIIIQIFYILPLPHPPQKCNFSILLIWTAYAPSLHSQQLQDRTAQHWRCMSKEASAFLANSTLLVALELLLHCLSQG